MKTDTLNIEITESGLIKIDADGISQPNHAAAEALIKELQKLAGGTTDVTHKHGQKGQFHTHSHDQGQHH